MKEVPLWKLSGKVKKSKILYDDIDEHIRTIVRLLNQIPWLATVSSCEGHPTQHIDHHPNLPSPEGGWTASGGIQLEIYDEDKWLYFLGLLDLEWREDYEHFNIGIGKGYHYSKKGTAYYTWGLEWCPQGTKLEECKEFQESLWCKLEYLIRKYIELEERGLDWEKYLKRK